jgi:hypothetical protein
MRFLNVFLSLAVSLLMALLVLEGGLRLIGMGPVKTLNQPDPVLGWSKVPGRAVHRSTSEFDVDIEVNSLGLRDDPMESPDKAPGVFRVVALGDSFTLGFAVEREHLFVDRLERWWNDEGRRVEVLNTGTEGYSTDQEAAWLVENGERFDPDLVLLFPYENDLYWNGQERYITGAAKPRFDGEGRRQGGTLPPPPEKSPLERFALTRFFAPKPDPTPHLFTPQGGRGPILKEWAALLTEPPSFMQPALEGTRGALRALSETCRRISAELVVVPIPSHSAVDPEFRKTFGERVLGLNETSWSPDRPVETFLELAQELGIRTLDPRPVLKASTQSGSELYHDVDWHLNPAGNDLFARFLHDELDAMGVFPSEHSPQRTVAAVPSVPARGVPGWLKVYGVLWVLLTALYIANYRDEPLWQPPLKVAGMLGIVFAMVIGLGKLVSALPPAAGRALMLAVFAAILGFVVYKLGRRVGTIAELVKSFVLRGHWYLLPLVVVLLSVGSLLVVAASSPLVAPFIYTLF